MAKIIRIINCLDCPLGSLQQQGKDKKHGGFVYCESSKYPKPRTVATFLFVSTKSFIPKWCPLQDEEDFLIQRM
ncbi:hypothetical protein ES703_08242 [subsurface metagenome]